MRFWARPSVVNQLDDHHVPMYKNRFLGTFTPLMSRIVGLVVMVFGRSKVGGSMLCLTTLVTSGRWVGGI